MKVASINVDELEYYFQYVKKEAELAVSLSSLARHQEQTLKLLENIKHISVALKILKSKVNIKSSDEAKKFMKKYAKGV